MKFFFNKQHKHESDTLEMDAPVLEAVDDSTHFQDEIASVIAIALHKHVNEIRDYENTVLTIQQVIRPYSPWSSKIYGLRQQPMYMPGHRILIR
jgi:hypothetical protein